MKRPMAVVWGAVAVVVVAGLAIAGVEYEEHRDAATAPLSLQQAIQTVTDKYPGQVIRTERETEGGRAVYEITLAVANNGSREFTVDARSGKMTEGFEESE